LLIYLIAVIFAGLAISWLHTVPWLAGFGIAMALFLPGYVYSQLILAVLPLEERILVSVGLSIVITGLSGLVLNVTALGLNAITWGLWLSAITLVGTGWVWLRRESKVPAEIRQPQAAKRVPWRSLVLYTFALACILLAFKISDTFSNRLDTPLTALWAAYDPGDAHLMNVGIRNQEGRVMTYDLIVETNHQNIVQREKINVENEKTYNLVLTFQQINQQPVRVLLFLPDAPAEPYREVTIAPVDAALQAQGSSR
jgi:uncharacterized membrane protein